MDANLIPGDDGKHCPGNPELCDECDYLICCTNAYDLCTRCRAEHGGCALDRAKKQAEQ